MFHLPLHINIVSNTEDEDYYNTKMNLKQPWYYKIDEHYQLDSALDLLSRYMQLDYMIAGGHYSVSIKDTSQVCTSYWIYLDDLRYDYNTGQPDSFFQT